MSPALVRTLVSDTFDFVRLNEVCSDKEVQRYRAWIAPKYAKLTHIWDRTLNTEWVVRN